LRQGERWLASEEVDYEAFAEVVMARLKMEAQPKAEARTRGLNLRQWKPRPHY
jgi:hypothetical protein